MRHITAYFVTFRESARSTRLWAKASSSVQLKFGICPYNMNPLMRTTQVVSMPPPMFKICDNQPKISHEFDYNLSFRIHLTIIGTD